MSDDAEALAAGPIRTVYVETNFILHLAYDERDAAACAALLDRADEGRVEIVVPAFALIEAATADAHRARRRDHLRGELGKKLTELRADASGKIPGRVGAMFTGLINTEVAGLKATLDWLYARARVLEIAAETVREAHASQGPLRLQPADAAILASVLADLHRQAPARRMLASSDAKAFNSSLVLKSLRELGCEWVGSFRDALGQVDASLGPFDGPNESS